MIKVIVWNEDVQKDEACLAVYPDGIHNAIKDFLQCDDISVTTATLAMENCGLSRELLAETDVLVWWGHVAHDQVPDELVSMIHQRVLAGMGLVVLHSAHHSKIFRRLMGTNCNLMWREQDRQRLWTIIPSHPIARGVPAHIELEAEEMYGEPFTIPTPDETVFIGWFRGGEVFRSGVTYRRENGKVFYFQPGHETNTTYHNPHIQQIIRNAVYWAKAEFLTPQIHCPKAPLLEE